MTVHLHNPRTNATLYVAYQSVNQSCLPAILFYFNVYTKSFRCCSQQSGSETPTIVMYSTVPGYVPAPLFRPGVADCLRPGATVRSELQVARLGLLPQPRFDRFQRSQTYTPHLTSSSNCLPLVYACPPRICLFHSSVFCPSCWEQSVKKRSKKSNP
ncbi:unnamed protein product [Periconia digitata]|uniref:Uncharacterized protein n=1 Tax=Periconia digitata TaxID=1303443 RepID=A0A9W4UA48_9PLEO|nr:unnamed protein product [Periconia digitata]